MNKMKTQIKMLPLATCFSVEPQWRPSSSKARHHRTSLPATLLRSCLLTSLIIPPRTPLMLSLPSSQGTVSVCVTSIVTIFSLTSLLCLFLSGDLCVRADRDILYLSYLVLWEHWWVMLTGMTDGDSWKSTTPEEEAVLSGERRQIVLMLLPSSFKVSNFEH